MPRTPARFTQSDLARAIRAARQAGDDMAVRVLADGSIEIYRRERDEPAPVEQTREWVP